MSNRDSDSPRDHPDLPAGEAVTAAAVDSAPAEITPANSETPHVAKRNRSGGSGGGSALGNRKGRGPHGKRGEIRERIRAAAHREFVAHGYDGTTMRSIARAADCDSAMVSYYFGSKQRLFRECMDLPEDPASEVFALLKPGLDGAGERIVRYALQLYGGLTGETMQALMRALMTDAQTSQRFRNYLRHDVLDRVTEALGAGPELAEQIELNVGLMYGIATMRYVVGLEPLASMPEDRLVAELAPIVQARIDAIARYL